MGDWFCSECGNLNELTDNADTNWFCGGCGADTPCVGANRGYVHVHA